MAPKRKLLSESSDAKKRKTIMLQEKVDINKRHVKGEKASDWPCVSHESFTRILIYRSYTKYIF